MLRVAQFGAGRIGKVHAVNIAGNQRSQLVAVSDPHGPSAQALADQYGARVMDEADVFADPDIDAVVVASSTNVHADQMTAAASGGKAIFCEKPIDLDINRVREVLAHLDANPVPVMLAFNRRFDPNFADMKAQIDAGAIGEVEMVTILSRDPGLPPLDYIKVSGGLYRDMMIHDFDMARFLVGEEFDQLWAFGSVLVDPQVGKAGDVDTAVVTMRTSTGKLVNISNSRRASYGYDQRIEVHGSKGMLQANNILESSVVLSNDQGVSAAKPMHFFLERYMPAYAREWDGFVRLVLDGETANMPTAKDGLAALELAERAVAAARG